jgi:hypothetical protein
MGERNMTAADAPLIYSYKLVVTERSCRGRVNALRDGARSGRVSESEKER